MIIASTGQDVAACLTFSSRSLGTFSILATVTSPCISKISGQISTNVSSPTQTSSSTRTFTFFPFLFISHFNPYELDRGLQIIKFFAFRAFKIIKIFVVIWLLFDCSSSDLIDFLSAIANQAIAFDLLLDILSMFFWHTQHPPRKRVKSQSLI